LSESSDRRKSTPAIAWDDFLQGLRDLLNVVKDECQKRVMNAEEARKLTEKNNDLQWYFRGYRDGVEVFLQEFWGRLQREDGWKTDSLP
jgi:hypothetical protein